MKKFILPLCLLYITMIGCNDELAVDQRNEKSDAPGYCVCNPCNANVSWNTATDELSPKMNCHEECPSGGSVTNFYNPYSNSAEFLYSTTNPSAPISLSMQAQILQAAYQVALNHRPPGKKILNISIEKCWIGYQNPTYSLYAMVSYGNCSVHTEMEF